MNLFDDFLDTEMLRPGALTELVASLDDVEDYDKRDFVIDCLVRDIHEAKGTEDRKAALEAFGKFLYNNWRKYTESIVIDDWEGSYERISL
jgi:hypothetical protein